MLAAAGCGRYYQDEYPDPSFTQEPSFLRLLFLPRGQFTEVGEQVDQ